MSNSEFDPNENQPTTTEAHPDPAHPTNLDKRFRAPARLPEYHQQGGEAPVQSKLDPRNLDQQRDRNGVPLWMKLTGSVAVLAAGVGIGVGISQKGSGKPETNPPSTSAPVVPGKTGETTTAPPIDAAKVMSTNTYHAYIAEHPSDKEALAEYVVGQVDIPSVTWDALPIADRATRTAEYVEWGTEKCFDQNLIGQDTLDAQNHLDAVKWSPYITQDVMSSAAKGNLTDLQKIETIRQMYECSVGSAVDANGMYSQQIKDNLTNTQTGFISQPSNAAVNRTDYPTAGLNSALNVGMLHQYGGTVNTLPTTNKEMFPFDGLTVSTPDGAAWFRSAGLNDNNYLALPTRTSDGKYIPVFGYSENLG